MAYFTIVHILFLVFYFALFSGLIFMATKYTKKKIFLSMIFAITLVMTTLSVFTMFVLDKYTKKGRIESITQKKILRNETISFQGKVRNVGSFTISECALEVKLVNNPVTSKTLSGSSVFNPTGNIFGKNDKPSTVVQTSVVAVNLKPNEVRNFTVNMPYPSYFSRASTFQYLHCR